MSPCKEQLIELYENYNDLGEDLVMLEAVLQASQTKNDSPQEYVSGSLIRISDYIQQHTKAIDHLARSLVEPFTAS